MTPGEARSARDELEAARRVLRQARSLLDDDELDGATNRLYYAAFHAARAALTVLGLHSRSHYGMINLLEENYGQADLLRELFKNRGLADYSPGKFAATREQVEAWAASTQAFVERCHSIVEEAVARGPDEPDPPPDV